MYHTIPVTRCLEKAIQRDDRRSVGGRPEGVALQRAHMAGLYGEDSSGWKVSFNICKCLKIDQEDGGSQDGKPTVANASNYYKYMIEPR